MSDDPLREHIVSGGTSHGITRDYRNRRPSLGDSRDSMEEDSMDELRLWERNSWTATAGCTDREGGAPVSYVIASWDATWS